MRKTVLDMGQWESRVNELFSMAIICKWSHAELLAATDNKIYAELNRKTAGGRRVYSSYMSGFVYGMMQVKRSDLWRHHLEFCYLVDGTLYSTHKKSDKPTTESFYESGRGHILADAKGAHYWQGTNKQFS